MKHTSFLLLLFWIGIIVFPQSVLSQTGFEHYEIDIHGDRKDFFELIDHIEIIPLEETEYSLLPRVEAYFKTPNGFGIIEKKSDIVVLFNKEGKFLRKIDRIGQGPGEYQNLGSVWATTEKINLFSSESFSLLEFDLDGKYTGSKKATYPRDLRAGSITPYLNGYAVQLLDPSPTQKSGNELMFLDGDLKLLSFASPVIKSHPLPINLSNRFSYLNERLIWKKLISDSIYIIDNYQVKPFMKFDFGDDWALNDPKLFSDVRAAGDMIMYNDEKVWEVISKVSQRFVMLSYHFKVLENGKGIIDRTTGEFHRLDLRKNNKEEDFDIVFLEWQGEILVSSLQAYDLEEFMGKLNKEQISIAGNLTSSELRESENPVLLKTKFKESF